MTFLKRFPIPKELTRIPEKVRAGWSHCERVGRAAHKLRAEAIFQIRELAADGRLRQTQITRRSADRTAFADPDECLKERQTIEGLCHTQNE